MSASRACFALLRSGPADPQHGRLSYGSALAPGSLFPHATLRTSVAQLFGHIGHLERLDGSGDPARLNDGENLGAIRLRGFCGHPVDLQKLLEISRPFAADAAQRAFGQNPAYATAFRYRGARAL